MQILPDKSGPDWFFLPDIYVTFYIFGKQRPPLFDSSFRRLKKNVRICHALMCSNVYNSINLLRINTSMHLWLDSSQKRVFYVTCNVIFTSCITSDDSWYHMQIQHSYLTWKWIYIRFVILNPCGICKISTVRPRIVLFFHHRRWSPRKCTPNLDTCQGEPRKVWEIAHITTATIRDGSDPSGTNSKMISLLFVYQNKLKFSWKYVLHDLVSDVCVLWCSNIIFFITWCEDASSNNNKFVQYGMFMCVCVF